MGALLEVKNLKKYFPITAGLLKRTVAWNKAVDDVSFSIAPGETLGLVGESGCGKTTVGSAILRLVGPTEGQVLFEGRDITVMKKSELRGIRKEMQVVFQDPYGSLNPRMTIEDIIGEPMKKHGIAKGAHCKDRVKALLEEVGLSSQEMRKYPHEFSGGQRQRVVIARALSLTPKFIICDEPVSALDVSIQSQILNLLRQLQQERGLSYLFIAHGMPVVRHISHRVCVMYLGKIVEEADCVSIFERSLHPYTQALMSAIPIPDPDHKKQQITLEGEVPGLKNLPSGCRFRTRCPHERDVCQNIEPPLREVAPGHRVACHLLTDSN